jgi:hypothetical protein
MLIALIIPSDNQIERSYMLPDSVIMDDEQAE